MRKEFALLALLAMVAFIGCKGTETTPEEDIDHYEGVPDNDVGFEENEDCCGPVEEELDSDITGDDFFLDTFFDDMPVEWKAFFTLKMSGVINDPENEDPAFAFLTKINATLLGTEYNLGDNYGMYTREMVTLSDGSTAPAVIGVGVGTLNWPVTNKLASLWTGQTAILVDDLKTWTRNPDELCGEQIHVAETSLVSVFEVWVEVINTDENVYRMECVRGFSDLNDEKNAYAGAMEFCALGNTEWAIGESMKMMQYSKMIDDPTELLAVMNEGLTSEDPEYRTDVCRCWASDGVTPMDCEAMKDEFGIGELPDEDAIPSDDDALLTDETPDDDVLISD